MIPGSAARLFICTDPDPTADTVTSFTWEQVEDLNNYTLSASTNSTDMNADGWIRNIPTERGLSLTATGNLCCGCPGQAAVEDAADLTGCNSLRWFRFLLPAPNEGDPNCIDYGFWAWPELQDRGAASGDPFSWGVALTFWAPPTELVDGQMPTGRATGGGPGARSRTTAQASGGSVAGGSGGSGGETMAKAA
jgi:hypothetical protein